MKQRAKRCAAALMLVAAFGLTAAGCSHDGDPDGIPWVDPAPPEIAARAEQVLGAKWNRDKVSQLQQASSRLTEHSSRVPGWPRSEGSRGV